MIKKTFQHQIIFDIETVPCLETARRVYPELQELYESFKKKKQPDDVINARLLDALYKIHETENNPKPFLKFFLHRVVSISYISRKITNDGVELVFHSLPNGDLEMSEADIIRKFLTLIGKYKPQLIGWCSTLFDMPCLMQRAVINGLELPDICNRPDKPWEGADYFAKGSDFNIDLMDVISSYSPQSKATLDEFARANYIPGKIGVSGADVADLWFEGKHREIVNYNECDTATTYLLWLEILKTAGRISFEDWELELQLFRGILDKRIDAGNAEHLEKFWTEWNALEALRPSKNDPNVLDFSEQVAELKENAEPAPEETFPANPIARSLSDLVTAKQLGFIRAISRELGINANDECDSLMQCRADELSKRAASGLIQHLKDLRKQRDGA